MGVIRSDSLDALEDVQAITDEPGVGHIIRWVRDDWRRDDQSDEASEAEGVHVDLGRT